MKDNQLRSNPGRIPVQPSLNSLKWGIKSALALAVGGLGCLLPAARAGVVTHGISAANITVVQNDTGNTTASVTCTAALSINDFQIRPGSNRGDFDIQIGPDPTDDSTNGVLMSCISENGRDNLEGSGTNFLTSAVDIERSGLFAYWIPTFSVISGLPEYNANVAGAYFPYNKFIGGHVRNTAGTNGGTNDLLYASPEVVLGSTYYWSANGQSVLNLTNIGINSQVDGVLLVTGGKNEANYALSRVNADGTWTMFIHDDNANGGSYEQDPIAFVYIPRTNTTVVSGKFLGDGTIDLFSDATPQFTVSVTAVGRYYLKMNNYKPKDGVLIISAEGGGANNSDNIVTYQADDNGFEIQSRDLPGATGVPGLQSPTAVEHVVSFVFIPAPTPGFSVAPTNNLQTSENGGTAMFSVVLDAQPTADVSIDLSSSKPGEGLPSPASITFTTNDWNIPQFITVTGQDDAIVDGPVPYAIILAPAVSADTNYSGMDPSDVSVINADNEAGITVTPSGGLTTTEAGGTATFTIQLNSQPAGDVTIGVSSSNTAEGTISPASVTFTAGDWFSPQTITVTGVDDSRDDGDISYSIITAPSTSSDQSYNNVNASDVTVVNLDDDTAGVNISNTAGITINEGGTDKTFTVALTSQPASDVVVHLTSTDTTEGTISPGTMTFNSTNWNTAQIATVSPVDDNVNDGNVSFAIVTTVTTSDALYQAIDPDDVPVTTIDNEGAITLPSGTAIFGSGTPAITIDGFATITDANNDNYNGGSLTVSLTANGTSDDRLAVRNIGAGAGEIGLSSGNVTYGGTTIGTLSGGTGASPLVIALNGSSSPASVQALARAITFGNVNSDPSRNTRSVTFALANGKGGVSSASTSIRVGLLRVTQFQEGADWGTGRYTGESDLEIYEVNPDTVYPMGHNINTGLWIDWPDSGVANSAETLLRFDNIFGTGPGQIPQDAVIVSADLVLNVNDSGDGSPLYRMLLPWDATNGTWNTFVQNGLAGIQNDDFEARFVADSMFGVSDGSGASGMGQITFSVKPDIEAWAAGETNCGWVMPGWPFNTDGTGFTAGENANVVNRPRLRVTWVPAGTMSVSFRQGVNDYAGASDTALHQNNPSGNFAGNLTLFSDGMAIGTTDESQVLIRFDNIIGTETNQIPSGAVINAAILDLASVGNNAMGHGGHFHAMLQPWLDSATTWASFTDGVQADGVEAVAAPTTTAGTTNLTPLAQGGFLSFELTQDVQAWVNGTLPNYGWVILPWPNGSDGWGFNTSELSNQENTRPELRVYFSMPVVNQTITMLPLIIGPSSVTVRFTGAVGVTYSVQRATGSLGTAWSTLGTATVGQDGTGEYIDTNPSTSAAFYRVSNP